VKFIFGKPILGIKTRITNKITETVDDIKERIMMIYEGFKNEWQ